MKLDIPESIRTRFVQRCSGDLQKLREIRDRSAALPDGTDDDTLVRTAHGLAGAGGTFGFPEVSRQAGYLEALLIDKSSAEPERRDALDCLIATLQSLTEP